MGRRGATREKIIVSVADNSTDDVLYTMNPDGSGHTRLFDFQDHPKHAGGGIRNLRVAPDGEAIFFSSDNAFLYTPAGRNLFRIASNGGWRQQITPGPNSGQWDQPCPCRIVEGTVKKSNGACRSVQDQGAG